MRDELDLHMGRRLRSRRRLMGMSQQELGDACGVRFQQIQKYECAANRMSAATLWKLATALDIGADYFFAGFGETDGAVGGTGNGQVSAGMASGRPG